MGYKKKTLYLHTRAIMSVSNVILKTDKAVKQQSKEFFFDPTTRHMKLRSHVALEHPKYCK